MCNRLLVLIGCLAFVAPSVWVESFSLAAQTPATTSDIPSRTPDGHPDLSGLYNVATITPVERPVEYGNRLVLTDEEAAAMEQYEQQRNQKDLEPGSVIGPGSYAYARAMEKSGCSETCRCV